MGFNLVELMEEGKWNQPCKYGHLIEGHSVYCHNENWEDAPRKCRWTWWSGGEHKDEDCPGFQLNPKYKPKKVK